MRTIVRKILFSFLVSASTFTRSASADDIADAKVLFEQGLADMDAKQYETGCKALAESLRLDRKPGTLFTLADCEFDWDHPAAALSRYEEYLSFYDQLPPDAQKKQNKRPAIAKQRLGILVPQVPHWTITLPPNAPKGTIVKQNGQVLNETMLGTEIAVDPGEYTFSTQAPDGELWENSFKIEKSERKTILLEVTLPPPPPPAAPVSARPLPPALPNSVAVPSKAKPGESMVQGNRTAGFTFLGVGGAVLAIGGIAGWIALDKNDIADSHCGAGIGRADDGTVCDEIGKDAGDTATTLAIVSTFGGVVGAVGVVTGHVLLQINASDVSPKSGNNASITHFGLLSASPTNALFGATGTF